MTNQIQPSYPQEEQRTWHVCRICGLTLYKQDCMLYSFSSSTSTLIDHVHETEHRLPENAQKRRELQEKIEEARS